MVNVIEICGKLFPNGLIYHDFQARIFFIDIGGTMKPELLFLDDLSFRAVLDSVQTNIFIADRDFKLVYMNLKAVKTLRGIENEIYKAFNVKVDDFVGESIHRFHRDPDQVESTLNNTAALPHEGQFDFGNIHLKSSINCILGLEGEIVGYIVNWEDKSKKVRKKEEMMDLVTEMELVDQDSLNY
jgi:methyl-accepting chemotaxis protein